jgi:hypothetical protein
VEECQEQEVCKPVTNLVCNTVMKKVIFTVLLHNVAAHNVSIRNVKVSKRERHITYSVTKRNRYKTFCNSKRFVTLYGM